MGKHSLVFPKTSLFPSGKGDTANFRTPDWFASSVLLLQALAYSLPQKWLFAFS